METNKIQEFVKMAYGKIAQGSTSCCSCSCGLDPKEFALNIGYAEDELKCIPPEANLGLSCGNPTAIAGLKEGEVVVDLGSGAGFDCFLAANKVGPKGKVIGVDMTPEMVEKARENAIKNGFQNVEFKLGEIENLPIGDNSVDVVISNCVINLSTDKKRVFSEIYRVLKPGGRIIISDIAILKPLPKAIQESIEAYVSCVAGAILVEEYKKIVEEAGFNQVKLEVKGAFGFDYQTVNDPLVREFANNFGPLVESFVGSIVSVDISGLK